MVGWGVVHIFVMIFRHILSYTILMVFEVMFECHYSLFLVVVECIYSKTHHRLDSVLGGVI